MNLEKILKYGLYVIAFLIPWITFERWIFPHMTSKAFVFYGFITILTALWVYMLCTDSRYRLQRYEWLMISPLLGYVFWMTFAGIFAKNIGLSFWGSLMRQTGLLTLYTVTLYTLMITSLSKRYKDYVYSILKWVVVSGGIVAFSVWIGDEGFNAGINVLRKGSGGGVTGNSSLAGAYLIFTLGFATLLFITKSVRKIWFWLLIVGILCSPLFINVYGALSGKSILGSARGAFLSIGIGGVIALLVYLTFSSKRTLRVMAYAGLALGALVFMVGWNQLITPRTIIHQKFVEVASGTRFAFWHIAQKAINERPFIGYGPGNFPIAQARYFDPQFLSKDLAFEAWTDQPHNLYYDNGVAAGYPGICLYFLFVGSLIYILYRNKKLTPLQKSLLIGTLLAYLVQDLVAFDAFITIFGLAVLAGVVYGTSVDTSEKNDQQAKPWHPYILVLLVAVALVGSYQFSYKPAQKVKLFATVLGSKLNERYPRYQEFLIGSPVGNYWDVSGFAYDEYKLYVKDPVAIKQNQVLLPHAIKDVDAYITYLEKIAATNETDYRLYLTIINFYNTKIYFLDLKYDSILATHIKDLIDYAQKLAPTDPRLYWLRAQLAAWKGDTQGVVSAYQDAIDIDPTLPISHRLLISFLTDIKANKLATDALANAKKAIPDFSMN